MFAFRTLGWVNDQDRVKIVFKLNKKLEEFLVKQRVFFIDYNKKMKKINLDNTIMKMKFKAFAEKGNEFN